MSVEGTALLIDTKFVCVTCTCGLIFAVPEHVRQRWTETGVGFNCPMGHSLSYKENEVGKLRKQLERTERERTWAQENAKAERNAREITERRLIGQKAAKTRLRNRIKNGVCPCCTRSFVNLREHIKTKHPDFRPDGDEAVTG